MDQLAVWIKALEAAKDNNVKPFTLAGPVFSSPYTGLVF